MATTYELGPILQSVAPHFQLHNHDRVRTGLSDLMRGNALLLGFIGDVWEPVSVRRILWLQRHVGKFAAVRLSVAMIVRSQPQTLYGFQLSNPLPMLFQLLADPKGDVHRMYNMEFDNTERAGLVLIDHNQIVRRKWVMPEEYSWPNQNELLQAFDLLN